MRRLSLSSLLVLWLAGACSSGPVAQPGADAAVAPSTSDAAAADAADASTTADDAGLATADAAALDATSRDPFALQPDTSEGLTNTSFDLRALLENGQLSGACAAWEADPTNRRKKLLCGKYMYFYETFQTTGVPAVFFDMLIANFPAEVGPGFSQMGMVADPYSAKNLPLGLAPAAPTGNMGQVPTYAYTCASCHFARLPDGRYAVGAANHDYDYGRQILSILLLPSALSRNFDPSAHHPDAIAKVQPMLDKLATDSRLRIRLGLELLPLLGAIPQSQQVALSREVEGYYARWPTGTQDFLIAPIPADDQVHTISKIISLFGIPRQEESLAAGMPHALLAWTGSAVSLMNFLRGFVVIFDGPIAEWPDARLSPLADYVYSLRAPAPPPQPVESVQRGEAVFQARGCLDCHAGPRGSGTRVFTYEEIGTDDAMKYWADPTLSGQPCCNLSSLTEQIITHGLKSPRLVGLWGMNRFLHNGSVDSLEKLLCLDGPRGSITERAFSDQGHTYGCLDLSADEKRDLIAYLKSH